MSFLQGLQGGVNMGNARDTRLQNQQIANAKTARTQAQTAADVTEKARESFFKAVTYARQLPVEARTPQAINGYLTGVLGMQPDAIEAVMQSGVYTDLSDQNLDAMLASARGEQVIKSNEALLGAGGTPIYENRPNMNIAAGGKAITGTGQVLADNPIAPKPVEQKLVEVYDEATGRKTKGYVDPVTKEFTPVGGVAAPTKPLVQVNTGDKGTVGQDSVDKKYADDYIAWTQGGGSDNAKLITQLDDALLALESGREITSPVLGMTPDMVKTFTNPESIEVRDRVAEVVQRNLRVILGAQFTEKEGKMLMDRAFNPSLSEEENARRVRSLITQIRTAAESKEDAARYFEEKGTLRGWTGKTFNLVDFQDAVSGQAIQASRNEIAAEMKRRGLSTND